MQLHFFSCAREKILRNCVAIAATQPRHAANRCRRFKGVVQSVVVVKILLKPLFTLLLLNLLYRHHHRYSHCSVVQSLILVVPVVLLQPLFTATTAAFVTLAPLQRLFYGCFDQRRARAIHAALLQRLLALTVPLPVHVRLPHTPEPHRRDRLI